MATIVSFNSFRRGTGKTSVVINLAALIAKQGQRVAIVDGDFHLPSMRQWFGTDEPTWGKTLNEYLRGDCAITETAVPVTNRLGETQGALYIVPSSTRFTDIQILLRRGFPVAKFQDGLTSLADHLNLDYILVDTAAGLSEDTLCAIAACDTLVILLRPDQQEYQGTAVLVDVARKLDVPRLVMLMNQVPGSMPVESVLEELKRTYKSDEAFVLPHHDALRQASGKDILAVLEPDNPFTLALVDVIKKL